MSDFEGPLWETSGLCGGPGQISCEDANELIQDFLDKTVDLDSGGTLHGHLDACPPCEHEFVLYQRILDALTRNRPNIPRETAERLGRYCDSLRTEDLAPGEAVLDETVIVTVDRTVIVDGTMIIEETTSFAETSLFVETTDPQADEASPGEVPPGEVPHGDTP